MDAKGHIKLADFGLSNFSQKYHSNQEAVHIDEIDKDFDVKKNIINAPEVKVNLKFQKKATSNPGGGIKNSIAMIQPAQRQAPQASKMKPEGNMEEIKLPGPVSEPARIIGTPDYIAPEVILGNSNKQKTLDWWSFGIIIYEFIVGVTPFCSDISAEDVFNNIKIGEITWPDIGYGEDEMTPEAKDLIEKCLCHDPKKR